ncbi:STAS domain-containing protein [Streptomyces sp. NPDC001068]|uniref:STAS domain-containing protein n=1 Tax=Streptomyces sp. NPDC001068 TaxID=3364544 RepID=UPI0036BA2E5A
MHLFRSRFRRPVGRGTSAREVVRLHGELDARSTKAIGRRLARLIGAGPQILEIDLGAMTYLSPDGCTAMFVAARAARTPGTRPVVTHADERARSILDQVGLTRVLTIQQGES